VNKNWVITLLMLSTLILASCGKNAEVSSEDTQFLVVGKTANYRQDQNSINREIINYHFFAEIFVKEGGEITKGTLSNVELDVMKFDDHPSTLETHGGRYNNEEDLNAIYPNGEYLYKYTEKNGQVLHIPVVLSNNDDGKTRIPRSPIITLMQDENQILSENIDPNKDLNISWTSFIEGGADKNGFIDDLIFAVVGNCLGEKIFHSGVPFGGGEYLTYNNSHVTINKDILNSGEVYQVSVEHAVMDTNYIGNVPTIATYAATSFLDFNTSGNNINGLNCAQLPIQMDKGQTDRVIVKSIKLTIGNDHHDLNISK